MLEGSVDLVSLHNASGWIGDRDSERSFEVTISLHDEIIGEGPADLYRPDLEQVGFGEGRCGFDIGFFRPIEGHDLPFVIVKVRGSNLAIPRTSRESYIDFVRSVTGQYPGAGRQRSIFGGLWTDRTDALDVLNGRRVVGSCTAPVYPKVRSFIADGLVEVAAGRADGYEAQRHEDSGHGTVAARQAADIARSFVTDEFADVLKAVFDDVPVLYASQEITETEENFYQACALERLSSPSELAVAYMMVSGTGARLEYVAESHELPEFGPNGVSRWTKAGTVAVSVVAVSLKQPVKSLDLGTGASVIVSPGLIHRVAVPQDCTVVRLIMSPKRVTPTKFLSGTLSWNDYDLGHGVRARL